MEGIHNLSYLKLSSDEEIGVAALKSSENLDTNAEQVQSLMAGQTKYIMSPPEFSEDILEY